MTDKYTEILNIKVEIDRNEGTSLAATVLCSVWQEVSCLVGTDSISLLFRGGFFIWNRIFYQLWKPTWTSIGFSAKAAWSSSPIEYHPFFAESQTTTYFAIWQHSFHPRMKLFIDLSISVPPLVWWWRCWIELLALWKVAASSPPPPPPPSSPPPPLPPFSPPPRRFSLMWMTRFHLGRRNHFSLSL